MNRNIDFYVQSFEPDLTQLYRRRPGLTAATGVSGLVTGEI